MKTIPNQPFVVLIVSFLWTLFLFPSPTLAQINTTLREFRVGILKPTYCLKNPIMAPLSDEVMAIVDLDSTKIERICNLRRRVEGYQQRYDELYRARMLAISTIKQSRFQTEVHVDPVQAKKLRMQIESELGASPNCLKELQEIVTESELDSLVLVGCVVATIAGRGFEGLTNLYVDNSNCPVASFWKRNWISASDESAMSRRIAESPTSISARVVRSLNDVVMIAADDANIPKDKLSPLLSALELLHFSFDYGKSDSRLRSFLSCMESAPEQATAFVDLVAMSNPFGNKTPFLTPFTRDQVDQLHNVANSSTAYKKLLNEYSRVQVEQLKNLEDSVEVKIVADLVTCCIADSGLSTAFRHPLFQQWVEIDAASACRLAKHLEGFDAIVTEEAVDEVALQFKALSESAKDSVAKEELLYLAKHAAKIAFVNVVGSTP